MPETLIYTKDYCGYCARAKALLEAKGAGYREVDVTHDAALQAEMTERSGRLTVPQVFIAGRHIGGFDDLAALDAAGTLDPLLGRVGAVLYLANIASHVTLVHRQAVTSAATGAMAALDAERFLAGSAPSAPLSSLKQAA